MRNSIQVALENEAALQNLLKEIREEIEAQLQLEPMDGVELQSKEPNTCVVRLSSIMNNPEHVLSAEYYIPSAQADVVTERLQSANTVTNLVERIQDMIDSGYATLGKNRHRLNPKTIQVLKEFLE